MTDRQLVALMAAVIYAGGKASGHLDDAISIEDSATLAYILFGEVDLKAP